MSRVLLMGGPGSNAEQLGAALAQTYGAKHVSAIELLRDNRHRITTYSTTRNDLRPLHLRPTALYNPDFDYAFGRLRADATTPPDPVANQLAFDVRKQKVDLRAPTDTPLTEFESILYRFFPGPFNATASGDTALMLAGVWPGSLGSAFDARVELDRSFRFRLELQQTIAKAASAVGCSSKARRVSTRSACTRSSASLGVPWSPSGPPLSWLSAMSSQRRHQA